MLQINHFLVLGLILITRIGSVGITPRKLTVRCLDRNLSSSQFLNLDFCLKEREKLKNVLKFPDVMTSLPCLQIWLFYLATFFSIL